MNAMWNKVGWNGAGVRSGRDRRFAVVMAALAAVLLLFGLSACGSSSDDDVPGGFAESVVDQRIEWFRWFRCR